MHFPLRILYLSSIPIPSKQHMASCVAYALCINLVLGLHGVLAKDNVMHKHTQVTVTDKLANSYLNDTFSRQIFVETMASIRATIDVMNCYAPNLARLRELRVRSIYSSVYMSICCCFSKQW